LDVAESKETLSAWEEIQEKLQNLRPVDAKRKALENEEIPALEAKLKDLDKQIPELRTRADEVSSPMSPKSLRLQVYFI
jgi:predicted RNase H-like nuclease (RuvC/YqgF family)